ncbi:MAG: helix-turn-helix domain-containing protein, partial [Chloroflexota bacterium]|nr:helix-turn-helix domain-containing protein [Chloroflexota bacterium]
KTSLQVGTGMPQMGEFSLAIAKVGVDKAVVSAPLYPIIALVVAITSFTTPYISRSANSLADFLERRSPRLIREYESSLTDWLATVRGAFSRDSDSARKVQGAFRVILVNLLIMLVLATSGTFALRSAEALSNIINIPTDFIGFIIGSSVLLLCLPCFLVIGGNIRKLAHEVTRSMIRSRKSAKKWRQETLQSVLRDSITVMLVIFLVLWFTPFITALISIGDLATIIPIIVFGLVVLLVYRSVSNIHRQVETTFGQVLIGEDYITTSEAATILGTKKNTVEKLVNEEKLPAVKIDGNWCVTRQSIEEISQPDIPCPSESEEKQDEDD